jgi:ankyrin repeat protein
MDPKDITKFITTRKISTMDDMLQQQTITDINVNTELGGNENVTALMYKSGMFKPPLIEWLLLKAKELGIDIINSVDSSNQTALWYAAFYGNPDNVEVLLNYGADRNIKSNDQNETPLDAAKRKLKDFTDIDKIKTYKDVISLLETHFPPNIMNRSIQDLQYERNQKLGHLNWRDKNVKNMPSVFGSQVIRAPTIQQTRRSDRGGKRRKSKRNKRNKRKTRKYNSKNFN